MKTDPVHCYFEGDHALFAEYLPLCRQQFSQDLQAGDLALTAPIDLGALRRLAHSLKTVLKTLGQEPLAVTAHKLDQACTAHDLPTIQRLWATLRQGIAAI